MLRRSHFFLQQDFVPGFLKRIQLPLNKAIFGVDSFSKTILQNEDQLLHYICQELNIGYDSLKKWRNTVAKYNNDPTDSIIENFRRDLNITISPTVAVSSSPTNNNMKNN